MCRLRFQRRIYYSPFGNILPRKDQTHGLLTRRLLVIRILQVVRISYKWTSIEGSEKGTTWIQKIGKERQAKEKRQGEGGDARFLKDAGMSHSCVLNLVSYSFPCLILGS